MNQPGVLILSADPLAAALLGAAVEVSDHVPVYAAAGETPRDALRRARPSVVLVDCDIEDACTEAFFGPALMTGARVAVFSSTRSRRLLEPIAREFGVHIFSLPLDVAELASIIHGPAPKA